MGIDEKAKHVEKQVITHIFYAITEHDRWKRMDFICQDTFGKYHFNGLLGGTLGRQVVKEGIDSGKIIPLDTKDMKVEVADGKSVFITSMREVYYASVNNPERDRDAIKIYSPHRF